MSGIDIVRIVKSIANRINREYGHRLDVDDLVSEGHLIAVERAPHFDSSKGMSLSTYLYGEVYLRLRNYVSRDTMKHEVGRERLEQADREGRHSELPYDSIALGQIRDGLGEDQRKIFDGISEGFSYRELSETTGLSKSAIGRIVQGWREQHGSCCEEG